MRYPNVLFLSTDEADTVRLRHILSEHVALQKVRDLLDPRCDLGSGNYDAVFCGWSFHRGTWNDALQQVQRQCPDLPVIVFSRAGGEREWVEVLEAGGFDLLVPPYDRDTVLPVLEHAIASHRGRRTRNVTPVLAEIAG